MTIDRDQLSADLIRKLAEIIEQPDLIDRIDSETNLLYIGLLSISLMRLIVYMEQTFAIAFEDEEMVEDNFTTVSLIADIVMRKLSVREGEAG